MKKNPFGARLEAFVDALEKNGLDSAVVFSQHNVRALTGVDCDNACLLVSREKILFYTDFRLLSFVVKLRSVSEAPKYYYITTLQKE